MKLRVFHQWILPGLGGEELRVQPFDAPRPPRWTLLPPMYPIGYMDPWLYEPDTRRTLIEIYETLFGALGLLGWSYDEIALAIGPPLRTAFERKDLVVLTPRRENAVRPPRGDTPILPQTPERPTDDENTWVAIELYQGKDPVPYEAFVVTPAGGSPIFGKLDKDGFKQIDGISAGICKVEFPNIDAREWGPTVLSPSDAPGSQGEVVRIESDEGYEVKDGEDLFTIATQRGFRNWQTIYRHAANASFRLQRPNPGVLFPKDQLTLPGRRTKRETVGTGRTHRFYVHPPTRKLRLRLRDASGKPIAERRYNLLVDGVTINDQDVTSGAGELSEDIPLSGRTGTLSIDGFVWELDIGALNPMKATEDQGVSGAQGRLRNLGYDVGSVDGTLSPKTIAALQSFQRDQGITTTGKLDEATIAALTQEHGS